MSNANTPWGFSVDTSNPFRVFPLLQEVALKHNSEAEVIDLSRGDPGFAFAPGVRAREFASFLTFLDTKFNQSKRRFAESEVGQEKVFLEEIASWARSTYVPAVAERYLKDLSEFIQRCILIGQEQGFDWTPYDILKMLFNRSMVSGGTYHDPQGELLSRVVLTWWHQAIVTHEIHHDDLVLTAGASHAIGTLFKLLGQEGIQYLNPGDKVLVTSPVYAPYNTILEDRGLETVSVSLNPITGEIEPRSLDILKSVKGVKLMLIIDPNNPSGFSMSKASLDNLEQFAEDQDALIITDEVYSVFFEERNTMLNRQPKRTLRIQSRSKIERSTGLRFGDLLITRETNDYLTKQLLKKHLPEGQDFKQAFIFAKGPGSIRGEFQHTTFIPGPAQILGLAHILLGSEERSQYRDIIAKNSEVFTKTLSLPHRGNRYYILFDLNEVEGCSKQDMAPEEKILELAKQGVIVLPANLFFSKEDREAKDRRNIVRACLANGDPVKIEAAAKIIRRTLIS